MDIEKLIEDLRGLLKQYGEKIPYGELVGAPWPYSRAGDLVWQDPEPYFIEQAATALSTLRAENKRLNKIVCSIPTTPDSGRTVSQYDKEMSMCAYLDDLEAENEKLRETVDKYATAARAIALHLKPFCDESFPYDEMIADAARKASDELEKVKEKYDAAIEYLREIEWCAGCKHFGGLDGCKKWAMGQCTEKHDLYEFIGPQKED